MVTNNNPFANEIAHFTDKRITNIIANPNSYSPQLVYGCKQEAEIRKLHISDNSMLDNPFSNEVKNYSDSKLISMFDGKIAYSPKLIDACRMEMKNRGLKIPISSAIIGVMERDDIIQIQQSLKNGLSVDKIKQYLETKGYSNLEALNLIDKAIESKEIQVIQKETDKDKSSGIGIFGILFMIYVVCKWIYILSK